MRTRPRYWSNLLTKLGLNRKSRPATVGNFSRKLCLERCEDRRMLTQIMVDSPFDVIDANDNVTTLREAIFEANQLPNHDTIIFDNVSSIALDSSLTITEPVKIEPLGGTGLVTITPSSSYLI